MTGLKQAVSTTGFRMRSSLPSRPILLVACALIVSLSGLALVFMVAKASASPNGIVVSELRFRGPAGASDEFIELRNTSNAPVDISGYRLIGCNSGGPSDRARGIIDEGNTVLAPGQYYLLTNSGYSGATTGDDTYSPGITDTGGVRLETSDGTLIDAVGSTQTTEACREGAGIDTSGAGPDNFAFERQDNAPRDTDDNAADFAGPKNGNPQNTSSPIEDPSPAPETTMMETTMMEETTMPGTTMMEETTMPGTTMMEETTIPEETTMMETTMMETTDPSEETTVPSETTPEETTAPETTMMETTPEEPSQEVNQANNQTGTATGGGDVVNNASNVAQQCETGDQVVDGNGNVVIDQQQCSQIVNSVQAGEDASQVVSNVVDQDQSAAGVQYGGETQAPAQESTPVPSEGAEQSTAEQATIETTVVEERVVQAGGTEAQASAAAEAAASAIDEGSDAQAAATAASEAAASAGAGDNVSRVAAGAVDTAASTATEDSDGSEDLTVLPDTGGASLPALLGVGASALLVAGGLLLRRRQS